MISKLKLFDIKCFILFIWLTAFFISNICWADEYVKSHKLYLGGKSNPSFFENIKNAENAAGRDDCSPPAYDCKFTYTGESWNNGGSWYWQALQTYTVKTPGYPDQFASVNTNLQIIFECPYGWVQPDLKNRPDLCSRPDQNVPDCDICTSSLPLPPPTAGNPIVLSTGVKQQVEIDYIDPSGALTFSRTYRSDTKQWAHNFEIYGVNINSSEYKKFPPDNSCYHDWSNNLDIPYCYLFLGRNFKNDFMIRRGNGRILYFGTTVDLSPEKDITDRVSKTLDNQGSQIGWQVSNDKSGAIEKYNFSGRLTSIIHMNGRVTTFTYSDASTPLNIAPAPGKFLEVKDHFGKILKFTYDNLGRMFSMTIPAGQIYHYSYDIFNNLISVIYPDGESKTYIYNESDKISGLIYSSLLTGILDENGVRFATFLYNSSGQGKSTFHGDNKSKYLVSYPYRNQTSVITPLGASKTYSFQSILGVVKNFNLVQPNFNGTGIASSSMTYDANGNMSSIVDFGGNRTNYIYDLARNLETNRTEASGSPQARTISTAWHPAYRIPLQIAEPKRLTTLAYDDHGNTLTKTIQTTTDANGASGFSAILTGKSRTWSYTYSPIGQLLTETGPQNNSTTYTYDGQGNLTSTTNAAGQVTTMLNYDANGNVGRIIDPNGLITDLSYMPRGWLFSRTVGGQVTSYNYDAVGQLTQVTFPDRSTISYTYDDAHRLTRVSDSLGNSIAYTLDNMGNRIIETILDPSGNLSGQTSRVYNALNQLQQQTGNVR